jgi:phosphoenolpyruvate carboxykinase (ATP)
MVRAVIEGRLDSGKTRVEPFFGLNVPEEVPGVPTEILDPRATWSDKDAYDRQAGRLASLFRENFLKFESEVDGEVLQAGPSA